LVATGAQIQQLIKLFWIWKPMLILDLSILKKCKWKCGRNWRCYLDPHGLFVTTNRRDFRKQKNTFLQLKLLLRKSKRNLSCGPKDENLFQPFTLWKPLNAIKASELDFQSKKISNFNEEQAEIISNRIIQNYNAFCQSLKRWWYNGRWKYRMDWEKCWLVLLQNKLIIIT
jgi:glutamyl-tRNA reductase